jgi:Cytochrome c bacterial
VRISRTTLLAVAAAALAACSSSEKTCADFCGAGNVCSGEQCIPIACTPACGAGTACQNGACVPVQAVSCTTASPGCASCIVSGLDASWVTLCGSGTTCDTSTDSCVSTATFHASLGGPGGVLHGPFTSGYQVTAVCVTCHAEAATQVMATAHWSWSGPTPDLVTAASPNVILNPGTIGKSVLVNNFCVATPSNDKRCDQCHAGYGGDPSAAKPQKTARAYASADPTTGDSSIPLEQRVDCLVCHSNPAAAYAKDPKNFGNPISTANLAVAAQDIRSPTRTNCGACHFYAGGGDNVKLMGSSLKNPTEAIDVHMGRGMECNDCHVGSGHEFRGGGVHVPTHAARTACADCHGAAPHHGKGLANEDTWDGHAVRIACQTCHIPSFSRGQFAKMDWDWSTAGDNVTCAGTPGCVAGVATAKVAADGVTPDPTSTTPVTTYDYIKGNFRWMKSVAPAYRWSNGKATHALVSDRADFAALGLTSADADRISLGEPVGGPTDGKIAPFKLMRGRQGFYLDGDAGFAIVPNVFGPGSFWGVVQAAGYSYPAYDFDGAGPIAAGQPSVDALWGKIFAQGAFVAGQVPANTPFARWDAAAPATPGYAWRYTKLYMDLNHEVAPKAQALGKAGCGDCHSQTGKLPLCELYAGRTPPWGVTCP